MADCIVQVENLFHEFDKQLALNDVSLSVPTGSIYGFLGPNGAGKTTTLRLILGLLKMQKGRIRVFGEDFKDHRIRILSRIGSLIEQPSVYLHLSARENLGIYRLSCDCKKERIDAVLAMVGLKEVGTKRAKDYSLGMKQRLAIAISLLNNPDLLILDEPANGLDPNGIIEMRSLLLELNREFGKTILVSSHLLTEVEKIATDVAIINKGRVLFQGNFSELRHLQSDRITLEIEVDNLENAKLAIGEAFPFSYVRDGIFQVTCDTKEDAALVNDLLVKRGVSVYNLKIMQNDLEALFVQIIKE